MRGRAASVLVLCISTVTKGIAATEAGACINVAGRAMSRADATGSYRSGQNRGTSSMARVKMSTVRSAPTFTKSANR